MNLLELKLYTETDKYYFYFELLSHVAPKTANAPWVAQAIGQRKTKSLMRVPSCMHHIHSKRLYKFKYVCICIQVGQKSTYSDLCNMRSSWDTSMPGSSLRSSHSNRIVHMWTRCLSVSPYVHADAASCALSERIVARGDTLYLIAWSNKFECITYTMLKKSDLVNNKCRSDLY